MSITNNIDIANEFNFFRDYRSSMNFVIYIIIHTTLNFLQDCFEFSGNAMNPRFYISNIIGEILK